MRAPRRRLILLLAAAALMQSAAAHATNDPRNSQQWGFHRINAEEAWAHSTGDSVKVAVVDSGVNALHEDLAGRVVMGRDYVDDDDDSSDVHGHGTAVAGVIGAISNNGKGIAGVSPGAEILAIRVLDANNFGSTSDFTSGVMSAADAGAQVINLSIIDAQFFAFGAVPIFLDDGITYATARGSLVVVSAGNNADAFCASPSFNLLALCVGATDTSDNLAYFSNYGLRLDVVAPGESILTTHHHSLYNDMYASWSGTSFAAPHVAGVAALLISMGVTPATAAAIIRCTATDLGTPGYDPVFGWGLVDAQAAVTAVLLGGAPTC